MIRLTAQTTFVCLLALSAAGCAVEVPMSAFRLAPPDASGQSETPQQHQDVKHITVD
jgi:hypothetical protein